MNHRLQNLVKAFGIVALTGASGVMNAQTLNWGQAGPLYTAGRARNIIVDKADPTNKTMYSGSSSSGLFKTTDAGSNWAPVNDQGTVRNISYLAQDNNNVVWVATGEGFLRYGQKLKAQRGTGVYKLVGTTLTQVADSNAVGAVINRIACSPTNAQVIALATNKGVMISSDGGTSFGLAPGIPTNSNVIFGMDVKFAGNGILYCSVGNERGNPPFGSIASKVYKSTDASLTNFVEKNPTSSVLANNMHGRIELAIAPSDNNVIYASIANKNNSTPAYSDPSSASLKAVFVSYNGGDNWSLLLQGSSQTDPLSNGGTVASGDYAHVAVVSPINPNQLFIGGYLLYVFTRTGGTDANPIGVWVALGSPYFKNTPYYLHENIHDVKLVGTSAADAKSYIVTDAGIYRSIDNLNSFQPFYSGFVTGQFNSVSIEAMPLSSNSASATTGTGIIANDGFIGGTGGNGFTYFSGKYPVVSEEINYLTGEVYNSEFSKLLPHAAFFTTGATGAVYRITDVRNAQPSVVNVNTYTGNISSVAPNPSAFGSNAFSNVTGTPFRLWENYGQVAKAPDSLIFYNDSLRVQTSVADFSSLLTQTTFTFSSGRPNRFALIDSIAIRTGTVEVPLTPAKIPTPFTGSDKKDIFIKLSNTYTVPVGSGITIPLVTGTTGPVSAAGVTLNASSLLDEISVTFSSAPFAAKTNTYSNIGDPSVYYRVFATIFYRYNVGDSITIIDNSISTLSSRNTFTLSKALRWSNNNLNVPKPYAGETNPVQKIPAKISARLAMVYNSPGITGSQNAVVVSKAPLNLNDPLNFVRVSQSGALTMDANGQPIPTTISITGKPILLEWSKGGTELYYATDDNKLYRISNINTILDLSPSSYSGKLSNDMFKYGTNPSSPVTTVTNPASPFRTTLLGTFTTAITSISISKNDSAMVLTFKEPNGVNIMYSTGYIKKCDYTNINFVSKDGENNNNPFPFPKLTTYCSLLEKDDSKKVFVGTENGLYYTSDITATDPVWKNVNDYADTARINKLPNVQVFDIKQQVLAPWQAYNSGAIFVATNGRGVWSNNSFYKPYYVSVQEIDKTKAENNLSLYPNPTNGQVTVSFNTLDAETIVLQVMDINGRLVKSENLGKLYSGQASFVFDTAELNSGMYIVNISGTSGIKRVAKLIVTK